MVRIAATKRPFGSEILDGGKGPNAIPLNKGGGKRSITVSPLDDRLVGPFLDLENKERHTNES